MAATITAQKTNVPSADPIKLAAIRWYMCRLEQAAIQAYMGRRASYDDVISELDRALKALSEIGRGPRPAVKAEGAHAAAVPLAYVPGGELSDCPWTICRDGSCRPNCDDVT